MKRINEDEFVWLKSVPNLQQCNWAIQRIEAQALINSPFAFFIHYLVGRWRARIRSFMSSVQFPSKESNIPLHCFYILSNHPLFLVQSLSLCFLPSLLCYGTLRLHWHLDPLDQQEKINSLLERDNQSMGTKFITI